MKTHRLLLTLTLLLFVGVSSSFAQKSISANLCTNSVNLFGHFESFENLKPTGSWFQDPNDNANWVRTSGTSPNPGPSSAAHGRRYLYAPLGYSPLNITAILRSPCFNVPNLFGALGFSYYMDNGTNGATPMGSLVAQISNDNGNTWTTVWSKSGNQGPGWKSGAVGINNYQGQQVIIRFVASRTNNESGDIAIDNMRFNYVSFRTTENAVEDLDEGMLKAYPNPFTETFSVEIPSMGGSAVLSVYDRLGQEVIRQDVALTENKRLSLDAKDLRAGVYTLVVRSDAQTLRQKLVKVSR